MSMDFSKLSNNRSGSIAKPTNPVSLFQALPNYGQKLPGLWSGQVDILNQWFKEYKEHDDVLISLNTGSGKTLVGLLIAQSFINQGHQKVVYVCNDNSLVEQAEKEAVRLFGQNSFSVHTGKRKEIDLFEQGKGFCITNYDTLFNGLSYYKKEHKPEVILFDDAHVAGTKVRSQFTLSIKRAEHSDLYQKICSRFLKDFVQEKRDLYYKGITEGTEKGIAYIHPSWIMREEKQLEQIIFQHIRDNQKSKLIFAFENLKSKISKCAIFVSESSIEIAPSYLPTLCLPYFKTSVKRIYLTASVDSELDAIRCFGKKAKLVTTETKQGLGDRLFIFSKSQEHTLKILESVRKDNLKFLITTPSFVDAEKWNRFGEPVRDPALYNQKLQEFKDYTSQDSLKAWFLINRYDGMDFPGSTCRLMVIDGEPSGTTLLQKFVSQEIGDSCFKAEQMATRFTQLFGRIIRGDNDFGVFIIENNVKNWLLNERNQSLLPSLIKRQIKISIEISSILNREDDAQKSAELIDAFIQRETDLISFYASKMEEEVNTDHDNQTKTDNSNLIDIAESESLFAEHLWNDDYQDAINSLTSTLSSAEEYDSKVAGWNNLSLGACFEKLGDRKKANIHYSEGRRRVDAQKIPRIDLIESDNRIPERLRDLEQKSKYDLHTIEAKLKELNPKESNPYEEQVRFLGELLGYASSRPEKQFGKGPDNLWLDHIGKKALLFELKTGYSIGDTLAKSAIGQVTQHNTWFKDESGYNSYQVLGCIILMPDIVLASEASPTDDIKKLLIESYRNWVEEFISEVKKSLTEANYDYGSILNEYSLESILKLSSDIKV